MRITGDRKLTRQLTAMKERSRDKLRGAVKRNAEEGERVARALAPVRDGRTKRDIFIVYALDGLSAGVEAAQPTRDAQKRALAIEFGRKKGARGTTAAQPYIRPAQTYLKKRFRRSIGTAIRNAAKEVVSNG